MATSTIKPYYPISIFQATTGSKTSFAVNFPNTGQYLVYSTVNGMAYNLACLINVYANGNVYIGELYKGSSLTVSTSTRKLNVSASTSMNYNVTVFALTVGGTTSGITIT